MRGGVWISPDQVDQDSSRIIDTRIATDCDLVKKEKENERNKNLVSVKKIILSSYEKKKKKKV